jgi:hypothetical protein
MKSSKADRYFSLFIRLRDADDNGLGKCFTCGTIKPVKEMDCGHWIKRQHQATRFNEINCQLQCKRCNAFEQGRDADFERELIKKYGQDKVNLLKAGKNTVSKTNQLKIDYLTAYYKQKAEQLAREKGIKLW